MRKISIKVKILLWFLGFFTLLIIVNQIVLFQASNQIVTNQSEDELRSIVEDVTEDLVMTENGPRYIDDDDIEPFIYTKDGAQFIFYVNNVLTYGTSPNDMITQTTIQVGETQRIEIGEMNYAMYDVYISPTTTMRAIINISSVDTSVRQLLITSLILSPIILILVGFGGYLILKKSFQPINDVIQTTRNIKETKQYHNRIPLRKNEDELYHMSTMINEMIASTEDVLNREKQFTSNVSHELRTPLAVLKAQLEFLDEKLKTSEFNKDMQGILKQMQYLEDMVKTILMLTKLNEEKTFQVESIPLFPLIEDVIESLKEEYKEKQIQTNLDGDPSITFDGDMMLITSLITNLISNAMKYNNDHGHVDVSIVKVNDKVQIKVSDTGIGMSEEDLKHVLEPFYRSDTIRTQHELSLGVGMTIVSNIINYYKGTLNMTSTLGEGTTFIVTL
jgi:signal transduction histidine kinase